MGARATALGRPRRTSCRNQISPKGIPYCLPPANLKPEFLLGFVFSVERPLAASRVVSQRQSVFRKAANMCVGAPDHADLVGHVTSAWMVGQYGGWPAQISWPESAPQVSTPGSVPFKSTLARPDLFYIITGILLFFGEPQLSVLFQLLAGEHSGKPRSKSSFSKRRVRFGMSFDQPQTECFWPVCCFCLALTQVFSCLR